MLRDGQGGEIKVERESALPSLQEALLWVRRKHRGLALPCQGLCWDEFKGWWMFLRKSEMVCGGSRTPVASGPPTLQEGCTVWLAHPALGMGVWVRVLRATTAPQGPSTWLAEAAVTLLLLLRFEEWHKAT